MQLHQLPHTLWLVLGALLMALGASFLYKGWKATVLGRTNYWSGFLPFTLVSPWFLHLPPGKNSAVKVKEGLICHMLVGPLFFLTAAVFLTFGADLLGLQATKLVNLALNCGDEKRPVAIVYMPPCHYEFPLAKQASGTINRLFQRPLAEDPAKRLLPGSHSTEQPATVRFR